MTAGDLKEYLEAVPDSWEVLVGGMRYSSQGIEIRPDHEQVVIK